MYNWLRTTRKHLSIHGFVYTLLKNSNQFNKCCSKRKPVLVSNGLTGGFQFLFPLESLIEAIQNDIRTANEELEKPEHQTFRPHLFLTEKPMTCKSKVIVGSSIN